MSVKDRNNIVWNPPGFPLIHETVSFSKGPTSSRLSIVDPHSTERQKSPRDTLDQTEDSPCSLVCCIPQWLSGSSKKSTSRPCKGLSFPSNLLPGITGILLLNLEVPLIHPWLLVIVIDSPLLFHESLFESCLQWLPAHC